jgi:replicative DNA helicase
VAEIEMRPVPRNNEAEQALLGALLAQNDAYHRVSSFLKPEHFADGVHGRIYAAIGKLIEQGQIANPVTLKHVFDRDGALTEIGGAAYLARLAAAVVTIINAEDYGRTIHACWEGRRLLALSDMIAERAQDLGLGTPPAELRAAIQEELAALDEDLPGAAGLQPLRAFLTPAIEAAEKAYQKGGGIQGVTTGIAKVDNLLGGIRRKEMTLMGGRPGMGKEQPLHAKVRVPGGWRTMGEMRVGDLVVTPGGGVARVGGVFPQGIKEVFAVTFADGRVVECGADHLFEVYSKHWLAPRVIPCSEIARLLTLVRYKKWLHVRLCDPVPAAPRDLPIDPYVLGVLIGDGDLHGVPRFMSADLALVERVRSRVGDDLEISEYHHRHFSIRNAGWVNKAASRPNSLKDALRALGLFGTGSRTKFIPADYLEGSIEQRIEVLRGLLDTDGTVEPSGTVRYCTTSHRLAHDVRTLAWSLGATCKWSTRPRPNGEAIILTIRHPDAASLFALERKRARLPKNYQYRDLRLRIDAVSPVAGAVECQCISIEDPAGLYLTDNFVVTHNTTSGKTSVYAAAQRGSGDDPAKGDVVAVFSLEMSGEQLAQWLLADPTGISASRMRRGDLSSIDISDLMIAAEFMQELPIFIDERPGLTAPQIVMAVMALNRKLKRIGRQVDMVVIDHIGLMDGTGGEGVNLTTQIAKTSLALRNAAKKLNYALLVLCQLSRKVEEREDKRPMLSDLRDSGSLEQDADNVIFLYRAHYYLDRARPVQKIGEGAEKFSERQRLWQDALDRADGIVEYIVAKQRNGPTGTVRAKFEPIHSRNADLVEESYSDQGGLL